MSLIPMEWVTRLFDRMGEFYGERWTNGFLKPHTEDFSKAVWRNGLTGLNADQIKNGLVLCKRHALDPNAHPPHVMEFFRFAKGDAQPDIDYKPVAAKVGDPIIAKQYVDDIRSKLKNCAT